MSCAPSFKSYCRANNAEKQIAFSRLGIRQFQAAGLRDFLVPADPLVTMGDYESIWDKAAFILRSAGTRACFGVCDDQLLQNSLYLLSSNQLPDSISEALMNDQFLSDLFIDL